MAELKPCPFCGGKAIRIDVNDCTGIEKWAVMCGNRDCPVSPITDAYAEKRNATIAWNRREGGE